MFFIIQSSKSSLVTILNFPEFHEHKKTKSHYKPIRYALAEV